MTDIDLSKVSKKQRPVVARLFELLDDAIAVASAVVDNAQEDSNSVLPQAIEFELASKVFELDSKVWDAGPCSIKTYRRHK